MSEITKANGKLKVQEVIDKILLDMCGGVKFEQTCNKKMNDMSVRNRLLETLCA